MVHTYQISGMTCSSCENKVKSALLLVDHVTSVDISLAENTARISMDKHVMLSELQQALGEKYQIHATQHHELIEQGKSWFSTYKPVLLIFCYISVVTLLIQSGNHHLDFMQWMRHFMAAFFLVFSFFKMLNLKEFAESYVMYDVIARKIPLWAYLYAFVELALGISYLLNFNPFVTNLATSIAVSYTHLTLPTN